MKRLPIVAATVIVGTMAVQKEMENAECKEHACANQVTARMPEQPHMLEEPPDYRVPEGMVEIPASPPFTVEIGSELHLEWLRQDGLEIPAS